MAKLSEDVRKKIADAVKKSWAARRARQQAAARSGNGAGAATVKTKGGRRRLSADARRRIAEAVKLSWANRRAGKSAAARVGAMPLGGGSILSVVEHAAQTLRTVTLEDIRPLAGRRDAASKLDELVSLASDLKRLIHPER